MKIFHIKFSTPIKKVKNKLSKILHFYIEIEQKCEKFPSGSAPRTSHNFLQKYQSRSYNHGGLVGLENTLNLESPHTHTHKLFRAPYLCIFMPHVRHQGVHIGKEKVPQDLLETIANTMSLIFQIS